MSLTSKKYIVTGAPSTGKTTLIRLLKKEVVCMDELSRIIIKKEQQTNGSAMPWRDVQQFAAFVFQKFLKDVDKNKKAVFCDRSLLDLVVYLKVANKPIPDVLLHFPYKQLYHTQVFYTPVWSKIYKQDPQRLQTFEQCKQLDSALRQEYVKRGFKLIVLPKINPKERVCFVKQSVRKFN